MQQELNHNFMHPFSRFKVQLELVCMCVCTCACVCVLKEGRLDKLAFCNLQA